MKSGTEGHVFVRNEGRPFGQEVHQDGKSITVIVNKHGDQ